jgi:hypothetical protein
MTTIEPQASTSEAFLPLALRDEHGEYPEWMYRFLCPQSALISSPDFDIANVHQWLHPEQELGNVVTGHVIYNHLERQNMLSRCFGLIELEALQKKGPTFFNKHFNGKMVFGWKSAGSFVALNHACPFLIASFGEIQLNWWKFDYIWSPYCVAPRFVN